ncbi:right-handed parallel beta-helix repeat-containing protein [Eggerthellaceae bacterium 24-137]
MQMVSKAFQRAAVLVAMSIALSLALTGVAHAATVTVKPKAGQDAYKVIQKQLDKAKGGKKKMNIVVKPGSYKLSHGLNVYSNTTLTLKGVKLTLSKSTSSNLLKIGATHDSKKGYAYKNIAIVGGNLNANKSGSTAVKIAHAKNVKLQGVTVRNTVNAHLMEVAGVNGFTVEKCTFKDQVQTKKAKVLTPEAIQIDVLVQRHMPGYRSEDLPMRNVKINKCTFSNVPRGVGSHTAIVNNPVNGIAITNSTFTKIKSTAIQGMNYINCTITGNTIKSAPRGIALYSVFSKGIFLPTTAVKEGKVKSKTSAKYKTPVANQNIVISNNKITVKGTDSISTYMNEGICVSGLNVPKKMKKTADQDPIAKGNYYISGLTVANNTISSVGTGIRLCDVRNASASSNTIAYTGKTASKTPYHGVHVTLGSKNVAVVDNVIKASQSNGVYVNENSAASLVARNKIASSGKYGIGIERSTAATIESNSIVSSKSSAIVAYNSSRVTSIAKNAISAAGETGLYASLNSTVGSVSSNSITTAKVCGIMANNGSTIKSIENNKISGAGKVGIGIYSAVDDNSIIGNVVSNSASYGVYVDTPSSIVVTMERNTLSGSGKASKVKTAGGSKVVLI